MNLMKRINVPKQFSAQRHTLQDVRVDERQHFGNKDGSVAYN